MEGTYLKSNGDGSLVYLFVVIGNVSERWSFKSQGAGQGHIGL
jgi:hypothetical protein